MRVGVGRIGVPLGIVVFIATVAGDHRTLFESLRTSAGWFRLAGIAVLCIAEWVLAAGWLIGAAVWYARGAAGRDRGPTS